MLIGSSKTSGAISNLLKNLYVSLNVHLTGINQGLWTSAIGCVSIREIHFVINSGDDSQAKHPLAHTNRDLFFVWSGFPHEQARPERGGGG